MSKLSHSFSVEYASKYGVECAILINHFDFWISHNQTLGRNFHDGKFWMYQTQQEIAASYPYWNRDQVQAILVKLVKFGVLIKGNFNKMKLDKTQWYTFANQEMITMVRFRTMENAKSHHEECENAQAIPDTKPVAETDTTTPTPSKSAMAEFQAREVEEVKEKVKGLKNYFDQFSTIYGNKFKIPLGVLQKLADEYGILFLVDQVNAMVKQEQQAEKDESLPHKKTKTTRIEKPLSYIKLSCQKNWAMSEHENKL